MVRLFTWLLFAAFLAPGLYAENVLLISVDTLRADRLSCYGYSANQTPNIDRWAREGILFANAYTESPLTLPAHATLLTGTFPFRHGIRENSGYVLAESHETLPEMFLEQGYRTGGFIGSYVLASEFGISQGFEEFDEQFGTRIENATAATGVQRSAEDVTKAFLDWLELAPGKDFFAFVHFYDPHTPRPNGYDYEVTQVDRSIGRIDEVLRRKGLLTRTHVILTSDHGESLGEHGEGGHGFFLYDSTLHVPLLMRLVGRWEGKSGRIEDAVSLVDLMPTLLGLAGLPVPSPVQGHSLLRLVAGQKGDARGLYAETFVPELHFGWSPLRSFRLSGYKYVSAPAPEFYDLSRDPAEKTNLYTEKKAMADQYENMLASFLSRYGGPGKPDSPQPVSPDTLEKLASLGYTGVSAPISGQRSEGVDPKDRIAVFEAYHGILNALSEGKATAALLERIEWIKTSAPEIRGPIFLRAWTLEQLGRLAEARSDYAAAVAEDPGNLMACARYGRLLIRMQRYPEAEEVLLDVLEKVPSDYKTRNNLAGLYQMTGRTAAARSELARIVDDRPGYSAAWQNLGRINLQAGDAAGAERAFRRCTEIDPNNGQVYQLLYEALKALGKSEEAKEAREKAASLMGDVKPR